MTIDFSAQQITAGDIFVDTVPDEEYWHGIIHSGNINKYGFSSTDIDGYIGVPNSSSSHISDGVSGSMGGNFYGPNAEAIGGKFNLSDSVTSTTIEGVFEGSK